MKTYKQRTESILQKTKIKQRQRKVLLAGVSTAGVSAAAAALALVLFLPYPTDVPSMSEYKDSEYYSVIKKLNEITYEAPRYKNNFEKWTAALNGMFQGGGKGASGGAADSSLTMAPNLGGMATPDFEETDTPEAGGSAGEYVESTDNQVADVIEADLLKRTDKYAFYLTAKGNARWNENGYYESLNGHLLTIYSIAGKNSAQVGEIFIEEEGDAKFGSAPEMYLSKDATRLTVFTECQHTELGNCTAVISLDISDITNVRETGRLYLSGNYVSSRLTDGKLLIVNSYRVSDLDFSDEATFLPQYGTLKNMQSVPAEDVFCSGVATTAKYTVVTSVDEKTLSVEDSAALLSYSEEVYVSEANLFLTQSYTNRTKLKNGCFEDLSMTEISCVSYGGEGLVMKGSFSVEGSVKNQYSMDEHEEILRLVTTYRRTVSEERVSLNGDYSWLSTISSETNANFYCIDLTDFTTVGKVEKFAPENETVESVRFDGDKAYVCTAVVVTLTDPVFFFDLSEPENITYTDTGTIEGYSSSLVNFGHGYLVGIGYNNMRELKIEVYTQGESKVESVCFYELDASFSEDYKAYLIDRENGLIGLGVYTYLDDEYTGAYLLLEFKNGEFARTRLIPHGGVPENKRAFYEDGYLYLFGKEFKAIEIS